MKLKKYNLTKLKRRPSINENQQFGYLTVIAIGRNITTNRIMAICKCDCGNEHVTRTDALTSGRATSCGCFHKKQITKHGLWQHKLYPKWSRMMSRCYNKKDKRYYDWGGRGISVCERWHSVTNFVADLESKYKHGLQLDRINNNGNYTPDNCRFVTHEENNQNKRNSVYLTYDNKTLCIAAWARKIKLSPQLIWARITEYGWSTEKTLTTPPLDAKTRCAIARNKRLKDLKNQGLIQRVLPPYQDK